MRKGGWATGHFIPPALMFLSGHQPANKKLIRQRPCSKTTTEIANQEPSSCPQEKNDLFRKSLKMSLFCKEPITDFSEGA